MSQRNVTPKGLTPRGVISRGGPAPSAEPVRMLKQTGPMPSLPMDSGFGSGFESGLSGLILPSNASFRGGDLTVTTDKTRTSQQRATNTTAVIDSGIDSGIVSGIKTMSVSEQSISTAVRPQKRRMPHVGQARTTKIAEMSRNNGSNTVQAPSHRSKSPVLVSSAAYNSLPPQQNYGQYTTSYTSPVPSRSMQPTYPSYNTQSHSLPYIDIRGMLQQNLNFFVQDKEGDTGLHLAVIHSQPELLDRLLYLMTKEPMLQSVIDEQNALYQTALHLAVHTQQIDMIRKLLLSGASLNVPDHKGNTALHIAAQFGSIKSLEELALYVPLQTLLDVARIRNNEGQTCVHIAAHHGNTDVLRKLKSYGVDIDMQDLKSGKTALHVSVENSSLRDIQFLLETCHANVNATTFTSCTALHIASGRGDISTVAYLLSQGANPYLRTDEGDTALEIAGSEEVLSLLTKAAALQWMF